MRRHSWFTQFLAIAVFAILMPALLMPFYAAADAHSKLSLEEFMQLPADKRMQVCIKLVATSELGECMNFKHADKPASFVSSERIEVEMMRCQQKAGMGAEMDMVACARERINSSVHDGEHFSELQFKAAEKVCAESTASADFGACMAAVLPHIDAKGKYH